MTVLKWSAPFALAIALAASPAMAEETPHATVLDHRVREANYNDRQVYEIPGVFRIATEIVFAKDEVVEHVALGDTVSWEVAPAANSLFIKPRERAGRTNLTVITRSRYGPRSYRFALSPTQRGSGFYTVVFRYPEQEAAEAQAQAAMAQLAQLKALERGAVKSALDIGVLEGTRNADYIMQGSTAIQPSEVSDNGQFTVMRFPNQRELPAFFIVNPDGSEAIASFDVRDEYVVLHGVYGTIRLRRGLEVLCIHNQKTDLYEETVVKNTFCVSFPVRLPAPLPSYSDSIDWLRSFRGQLMHNPCIDLYPVEAEAAYHNPYSHPRIEQRRMRTKLLLGVFRRHQSSRSRIAPTRVALLSLLQHRHQTARSSAPCGTSPVSTKRQSAISNFRASATIPTLAARPPFPLKRLRYQTANSLLG